MKPEETTPPASRYESGFSMLELLAVLAIVMIMIALTLPSWVQSQKSYGTDDAAGQVVDFVRFAYQTSLTQRQTMRVSIDPAAGRIRAIDENGPGTSDDVVLRDELLPTSDLIMFGKPDNVTATPPAPFAFTAAPFNGSSWEIRFRSDGVAINSSNTPQSATIYLYSPLSNGSSETSDVGLTRAITIFGPAGSVRLWGFNGSAFVQR